MQYTIKSGDTLSKIASANGTTVAALMATNPSITNANVIRAGASLSIPTKTTSSTPTPPPNMTAAQQTAWDNAVAQIPKPAAGTVPPTDAEVSAAAAANPAIQAMIPKYGSAEAAWAATGGDLGNMTDQYGTPFSQADQASALSDATAATQPYYTAEQANDTASTASTLAKTQTDYNNANTTAAANFQQDKTNLDQTAATNGVLFSGGRAQKNQNLANSYNTDASSRLSAYTNTVGNTARDFQYKYGNDAANGLSSYYNAGTNNYNANVANGGATTGSLSSVYNVGANNFQGTEINAAKAAAQQRAAGLLWNKGNKIVPLGYKNQY